MKQLDILRKDIDKIDEEIVALYEKRMKVSEEVAKYKLSTGKNVLDRSREENKLNQVKSLTSNPFNEKGIVELYEQIMSMSRKKQYSLMVQSGVKGQLPFIEVESLKKKESMLLIICLLIFS